MMILVLAAHPDDEVLGCGGSIARWVREGHTVRVMVFAENDARHHSNAVKDHMDAAMTELGYQSLSYVCLPDQQLESYFPTIVGKIEEQVAFLNPDLVVGHTKYDLNRDHRIVNEAMLVATRAHRSNAEVWEYPIQCGNYGAVNGDFRPNVWVRLAAPDLQHKKDAMECYKLETQPVPGFRNDRAIEAQAVSRGLECYSMFAEAFVQVKRVL